MRNQLIFEISGVPQVQERPRKGKYGNFYSPSSKAQAAIGTIALVARQKAGLKPFAGAVGLSIKFYGMRKRSDLSNCLKLVEDAMNKVVYDDDWQIEEEHIVKHPMDSRGPRTEVTVWELKGE